MRTTVAERLRAGGNLLIGRSAELQRLDTLLDPLQLDRPSILHVHGPGGVGKTALLRAHGIAESADVTGLVRETSGHPSRSITVGRRRSWTERGPS